MFDYDDINLLIEALDSWVTKDRAGNLLSSIMLASVIGKSKDTNSQEKIERKLKSDEERLISEEKNRERKVVFLKAKLFELQDKLSDMKGELTVEDIIGK